MVTDPLLFTFRRCPYAMRARLAIAASGVAVTMREVNLRDKPAELLALSPKATVPVLQLGNGSVLEESLDIMRWALASHWPDDWLDASQGPSSEQEREFLALNDRQFKPILDRYKYPSRFPGYTQTDYRGQAEFYFDALEHQLDGKKFLFGTRPCLLDAALLPFVRQFAMVDTAWFRQARDAALVRWLDEWLASSLFVSVMEKTDKVASPRRT